MDALTEDDETEPLLPEGEAVSTVGAHGTHLNLSERR